MQFSAIILSIFAATAAAVPSIAARNQGDVYANCPTNTNEMCCNDSEQGDTSAGALLGSLGGLTCVAAGLLGNACKTQIICCVKSGQGASQSCTNKDGTEISVPISIGKIGILKA